MKTNPSILSQHDLLDIVRGSCFFGSGGGGTYQAGCKIAKIESGEVKMISLGDLKNPGGPEFGVTVAYMGAPEKIRDIKNLDDTVNAVKRVIQRRDIPIDKCCIVPIEIGAVSSIVACKTAALLGIPVLDADGAGRAVPTLELCTFATNYVSVNPTVLYNNNNFVEINLSDEFSPGAATRIESLARPIISMPEYSQKAAIAMWPMEKSKIPEVVIEGTLTICMKLGEHIRKVQETADVHVNPKKMINFINEVRNGVNDYTPELLYSGTLVDGRNETTGGFDFGTLTVVPKNPASEEHQIKLIFQNETLLLWDSALNYPRIMAPDLISYVISGLECTKQWVYSNGDIIENGTLKPKYINAKIDIFGLKAPEKLLQSNSKIQKHRTLLKSDAVEKPITLPEDYMAQLNKLGYYGTYECFLEREPKKALSYESETVAL